MSALSCAIQLRTNASSVATTYVACHLLPHAAQQRLCQLAAPLILNGACGLCTDGLRGVLGLGWRVHDLAGVASVFLACGNRALLGSFQRRRIVGIRQG